MDLALVDVTSFGPKTCSAYENQRRPRPASDQVAAGWELREAAGRAGSRHAGAVAVSVRMFQRLESGAHFRGRVFST